MATKRTLTVTEQNVLANLDEGKVLYEVKAIDSDEKEVDQPLRAFLELSLGEAVEYEVVPYDHPEHGRSYTLVPPKRESRSRLLEKRVVAIEERLDSMDKKLAGLVNDLAGQVAERVKQEQERDEKYGEDLPE